jgi:hypothetical protein
MADKHIRKRPGPDDRLVPLAEAARRLGISREALRKRIQRGDLAAVREETGRGRYLVSESVLAELAGDVARIREAAAPAALRVVGEGDVPVQALSDLVALLQGQFEILQGELGRVQGELDSAQVRNAALQGEVERLRARVAAAPTFFLSRLGRLGEEWSEED